MNLTEYNLFTRIDEIAELLTNTESPKYEIIRDTAAYLFYIDISFTEDLSGHKFGGRLNTSMASHYGFMLSMLTPYYDIHSSPGENGRVFSIKPFTSLPNIWTKYYLPFWMWMLEELDHEHQ